MRALWIALCLAGQMAAAQTPTQANLEYAQVNSQPLRLDLYLPAAPAIDRPLLIFVHGGGWNSGSRVPIQPAMLPLLDQGIALASVDYRLVNAQHAALYGGEAAVRFPAAVHDLKAAVRFLRANAANWGLDPQRFGLWGSSAGSHLAVLTGLSGGDPQLEGSVGSFPGTSSTVQLIVDAYGPSDILRMGVDAALAGFNPAGWDAPGSAHANLIGCGAQGMGAILANLGNPAPPWPGCVAQANLANPVLQVDPADPPVWIGHADNDSVVPWTQSQRLFDALQAAGVPSSFVRVGFGGHQLQEAQYAQARGFVTGIFGAGGATLSPASLSFSATVTSNSAAQIVTYSNATASAIVVNSLALTSRFNVVAGGSCGAVPFTLSAGSNCTQQIVFNSASVGSFSGILSPNTTPPGAFTPTSVALSGIATAAAYSVSPASLSFSATVTATSPTQALTLSNDSNVQITISNLALTPRFLLVPGGSCGAVPITIGAGQSCTVQIAFTSQSVGSFSGQISITTTPSTVQTPTTAAFSGTATPAAFNVSPASLGFNATVTATSPTQALTLSNDSDVPINISNLATTPRFLLVPGGSCGAVPIAINAGQSCTQLIAFTSASAGSFSGQISITTSPSTVQTPTTVAFSGTATPAALRVNPASLNFSATVTATSPAQTLTLSNDSDVPINISSLATTPRFLLVPGGSCGAVPIAINAGQSCTQLIAFTSQSVGSFSGQISITTSPSTVQTPTTVAFSGTATPAAFSVSPASLSFSATVTATSPAQALTLSNDSDVPINISSLATTPRFLLVPGGSCGAVPIAIDAGQSCTVLIAFASQSIGSNFSGQVTINTLPSSTQTPATIALLGSATALPALLEPAQLDFGEVSVFASSEPQLLAIGNADDSATLVISGIQFSSVRFARVAGGNCPDGLPVALPAGSLCSIALVYRPILTGPSNATVQFSTTPGGIADFVPATVSLSGTGTPELPLFQDGFESPVMLHP